MFRRYRTFACLTVACVGTLLMCASPAIAVRREPTPEQLWKAFPLNPAGKRLVKTETRPFVPPTTEAVEAFVPASDKAPRLIVRPTLLVLLCAFITLFALFRLSLRRSSSHEANQVGSHARLLTFSVIGAIVAAQALYGYAIYTVVLLL